MRVMAIADEPAPRLWGDQCRAALEGIDLILSAGDLPASYLSFLTCFTSAPVVYVHGNHDDRYEKDPPGGCLCAEDAIVLVKGIRILGLGGSMRYRPDGKHMYSEKEMARRISALRRKIRVTGGFDILLTHAPIRGCGDQDSLSHMGFACFGSLITEQHPAVMVHGHIHQAYSPWFMREREFEGVPVINACGCYAFDLPETPNRREPSASGRRYMDRVSRL